MKSYTRLPILHGELTRGRPGDNAEFYEVLYLELRMGGQRKRLPPPLRRKWPDALDRFAEDPALVLRVEEVHLVLHDRQCLRVAGAAVDDRPVGGPHQTLWTES